MNSLIEEWALTAKSFGWKGESATSTIGIREVDLLARPSLRSSLTLA
jgi:hypothetical protein